MQKIIDVHIGEVKIAKNGELLKTILGSCVGIGIIWQSRAICGLAHCLLPQSPTPTFEIGARYVDQATRSLIALMKIGPEDFQDVNVIIVGGGNMTKPGVNNPLELVGSNNFKAAIHEAQKYHFKILYAEGGGEVGRKFSIDSCDYTYQIEKIPRMKKPGDL